MYTISYPDLCRIIPIFAIDNTSIKDFLHVMSNIRKYNVSKWRYYIMNYAYQPVRRQQCVIMIGKSVVSAISCSDKSERYRPGDPQSFGFTHSY